jgi:radical SAM-linked protein
MDRHREARPGLPATAGFIGGRLTPVNTVPDGSNELPEVPPPAPREAVQRWRLVLSRDPAVSDGAQREQLAAWEAALAGSGLPVAGLDAPKPRPRFAIAAPLAVTIPGEAELLDVWLVERQPAWRVREALGANLPAGWHLVDAYDVWLGEAALPGRVVASVYRAEFPRGSTDTPRLEEAAKALLAAISLPRERRKGDAVIAYDLRPFVDEVEVAEANGTTIVRMTLRHDPEKGVGRPEELLAALGEAAGLPLEPASLVRERLVLGVPPPPAPPAPRRRPGQRP